MQHSFGMLRCSFLVVAGCGRLAFETTSGPTDDGGGNQIADGMQVGSFGTSVGEPGGEYAYRVTMGATYSFVVKGAGGGASVAARPGGAGGANSFDFTPLQPGVFRIVVGGGGANAPDNHGAAGGGASSIVFDPDADPAPTDAYPLAIAGGGGGGGLAGSVPGGAGGGVGAGGDCDTGGGAAGDGTGGSSDGAAGGSCASAFCQGGAGGDSNGTFGYVAPGFGKGAGTGASYTFGGGGGGGFGGGAAPRYGRGGGGGAGRVFAAQPPAILVDTTVGTGQGSGSPGGTIGGPQGVDGSVLLDVR